ATQGGADVRQATPDRIAIEAAAVVQAQRCAEAPLLNGKQVGTDTGLGRPEPGAQQGAGAGARHADRADLKMPDRLEAEGAYPVADVPGRRLQRSAHQKRPADTFLRQRLCRAPDRDGHQRQTDAAGTTAFHATHLIGSDARGWPAWLRRLSWRQGR
ncbi:hypothetical protein RZS08_20250, partial [Arthrospira platensis SPKY1]|nr:hypothetical protein [Arthrospira platensis SPKY1]